MLYLQKVRGRFVFSPVCRGETSALINLCVVWRQSLFIQTSALS
jgi:hypothetical protein